MMEKTQTKAQKKEICGTRQEKLTNRIKNDSKVNYGI
jgi:hypothetical protein